MTSRANCPAPGAKARVFIGAEWHGLKPCPSTKAIYEISSSCYSFRGFWFLIRVRYHRLGNQEGARMRWYHYVAYFFGGAFLANALPHLGNGISGHAFQSPFASPPGEGLSSSTVNVVWGLFNLVVGYLLVCRVGSFDLRKTRHVLVLGAGILMMSLMGARAFGRFHGGLLN